MLNFQELTAAEQDQAVTEAISILMVENEVPSLEEARSVAESAHYPEGDDLLIFLQPQINVQAQIEEELTEMLQSAAPSKVVNASLVYAGVLRRRYDH